MKREVTISAAVVIAVILISGGAFFYLDSRTSDADSAQPPPSTDNSLFGNSPTDNPAENTMKVYNIDVQDFAFQTPELTINVGDTIIWTNFDSVSHTVTSDSGNELNSEYLSTDENFAHTFTEAGTFDYHCIPHPNMKGKIIVR
ncbi:MAG: cupredoxin family copper-binding protein [Nanoarchaeota archaeon]